MSVRLMGAVFELQIAATEKLVLLAMADHARDDGTGCYPSVGTLARKTSQSRRGVQGIMRRLEQSGWIIPSRVSKGRRTTEYRILLENRAPGSLFPPVQQRTPVHSTANLTTSNRAPGSPEPLGTVLEPKKTPRAARAPDPRHQVFVDFAARSYESKRGQRPHWSVKDFANLKTLLRKDPDLSVPELEKRWTHYIASTEAFTAKQKDSLAYFCAKFDQFIDGPISDVLQGGNRNGVNSRNRKATGAVDAPAGKTYPRAAAIA